VLVYIVLTTGLAMEVRSRLTSDSGEAWFWGMLPVAFAGASWLLFALVYRSGVAVEPSKPLPFPSTSRNLKAAWIAAAVVVGLGVWIYSTMFPLPGRRRSGRRWRRSLAHDFPDLVDALWAAIGVAVVALLLVWLLIAVARPWLSYVRHRREPARVDAVWDVPGVNAIKLVYRPTVGLGAPMRVRLGSRKPVVMVPGQALGILMRSGASKVILQGRRTRLADSIVVELELAPGEGTLIVFNDGLFRRAKLLAMPEVAEFSISEKPFTTRWSALSYGGLAVGKRVALRLARREPGVAAHGSAAPKQTE
jgi:hypothetical protein